MFDKQYAAYVQRIETGLETLLPQTHEPFAEGKLPQKLCEAMRYSLLAGGKRVRPVLLLAAAEMLGVAVEESLVSACALEMIHTYSLVHDDLPGMDDDEYRRGKLTNHKVYGVGPAILAGDGLLNYAYECMLSDALRYPQNLSGHVRAAASIAYRAGVCGMIAGQSIDLMCEHSAMADKEALAYIHAHKTSDLFTAPVEAACALAQASDDARKMLVMYAQNVGLAFQIEDDLLDIEGNAQALGKQTGMDAQRGKMTWPALYGVSQSRQKMEILWHDALEALDCFGEKADFLRAFVDFLRKRES